MGNAAAAPRDVERKAGLWSYAHARILLLKPRVMSLVVFTGAVGALVAPAPFSLDTLLATIVFVAVGAGACGALNMWYDADIDRVMRRTALRPIPTGQVSPREALVIGLMLSVGSVVACAWRLNLVAAAILALTIAFYIFVYTVALKRRTPYNIVIGGAAGAFPPMIGWAAATGEVGFDSLALFLIIFLWTPPHFWALALFRSGDYEKAGVPMLPVVAGPDETTRQIFFYTVLLVAASFAPVALGFEGAFYAAVAAVLGGSFLIRSFALLHAAPEARDTAARRVFGFSIAYLFLLFVALILGVR